ncbi:MAG: zf-TFIIB domain-containing protein [Desulfobulbaceae bacterium]
MNCPKCEAEMELVRICGVEIDRCTRCRGIWFDRQEQDRIQCARGSHKADIGHSAIGEYYNTIRDIACPRCGVAMREEELRRGRIPILIETCPQCHGSYFDAGEFRDFAEPTILEFARDLVSRLMGRKDVDDADRP